MPQRTCGTSGCPNAHRARGLCSSCYNRQYQPARRWIQVEVPCARCGKVTLKPTTRRYGNRFCSLTCRDLWRKATNTNVCPADNRNSCTVPWRSCPDCGTEWFRAGGDRRRCDGCFEVAQARHIRSRDARAIRLAEVEQEMRPRRCDDCAAVYAPATTIQRYCSARCLKRVGRRERKAREHGTTGSFTWSQVMRLFIQFDRCCAYCAEPVTGQPDPDHVIPLSRHGHNGIGNILPACRPCNCDKRDLLVDEWNADRARRGLPPRITAWDLSDPRYRHLTPALAHAG